jgi:putative ABC transport system substrate-binding protein
MKRPLILVLIAGILMALVSLFAIKKKKTGIFVGIIMPINHAALDDITNGFQIELMRLLGEDKVRIEVQNAMGDINLQKSSINKFLNDKVDLLVPVTTSTTQMATKLASPAQKILFLAANIPADSALAKENPALMGVVDEIPVDLQLSFIEKAMPQLKKLALVYSSSDKVFADVESFIKAASEKGILIQKLMVQNVADLYTVSSRIESDAQAIFILKDNLVASGISTLVQQANERKIPLITSDEGSNKNGGAFAIGVIEADIGRQGAKMAAELLMQGKINGDRIQNLRRILVFINKEACKSQGVDVNNVVNAAALLKLEVIKE